MSPYYGVSITTLDSLSSFGLQVGSPVRGSLFSFFYYGYCLFKIFEIKMVIEAQINGFRCKAQPEVSLISVFKFAGLFLPRFCFHNNLAVAGNCRACLLEIVSVEKPVAACVTDLERNFQVWSESPFALKARENVLEILLSNHPLDCPICDQAGECDLQDQAKSFGNGFSRFFIQKRGVIDKNCGPVIKTIMTRCIHCTRCIRFTTLVDGPKFGMLGRGSASEIGLYNYKKKESKLLGNVIDLCPVGALTARAYAFKARPRELRLIESLDLTDGLGANVYVSLKGSAIIRISPKPNKYINGNIISDKCRYSASRSSGNQAVYPRTYCRVGSAHPVTSWFRFLTTNTSAINKKGANFLVSPELSLHTLLYLKQLTRFSCGQLSIKSIKGSVTHSNYYFYAFDKLNVLDVHIYNCLLLSVDPKADSTLISFKLKLKYQKELLTLFSFGFFFSAAIKINFLNLSSEALLGFFEAKNPVVLPVFSKVAPLFLFGSSFLYSYKKFLDFFLFLKSKLNGLLALKLNKFCNDESFLILNIRSFFKKTEKIAALYCIILYDHLLLRKNVLVSAEDAF